MPRRVTRYRSSPKRRSSTTSFMAQNGLNTRDLSQLQTTNTAQKLTNMMVPAVGQAEVRKGLESKHETASITGHSLLEYWYNDIFIKSYGTSVGIVDVVLGTEIVVKSDFSEYAPISGGAVGNYFLLGTGGTEKVSRISITLDYKTQTGDFTVGSIVTGGASGATATILEDSDSGTTGTLTLGNISGVFESDEAITDELTGVAVVDGVLGYAWTEITNAPIAKIVKIAPAGSAFDAMCLTGDVKYNDTTKYDTSTHVASDVDDGSNPPFATWNDSTVQNQGYSIMNRGLGTLNTIASDGERVVLGYANGRTIFTLASTQSDTPAKLIQFIDKKGRESMERNAVETSIGIVFAHSSGIRVLPPRKKDSILLSKDFEDSYFDKFSWTNVDIIEDTRRNLILITAANDSTDNNIVLVYDIAKKHWTTFSWDLDRFADNAGKIYGVSSIDGHLFELFQGYDDNNIDIPYEYQQEIQLPALNGIYNLQNFAIQAIIGEGLVQDIRIDIHDREGVYQKGVAEYTITGTTPLNVLKAIGSLGLGGAIGASSKSATTATKIYQNPDMAVINFTRLIINIQGTNKLPIKYNFFLGEIIDTGQRVLNNNLTQS